MKKNSGFTLIEVVVALMISVILMGVSAAIFMEIFHINKKSKVHYDMSKTAQGIMEEIRIILLKVEEEDDREQALLTLIQEKSDVINNNTDYEVEIILDKLYHEKSIYEVVVKLQHEISNEIYFLHNYLYDSKGDIAHGRTYQEFSINSLDIEE